MALLNDPIQEVGSYYGDHCRDPGGHYDCDWCGEPDKKRHACRGSCGYANSRQDNEHKHDPGGKTQLGSPRPLTSSAVGKCTQSRVTRCGHRDDPMPLRCERPSHRPRA